MVPTIESKFKALQLKIRDIEGEKQCLLDENKSMADAREKTQTTEMNKL